MSSSRTFTSQDSFIAGNINDNEEVNDISGSFEELGTDDGSDEVESHGPPKKVRKKKSIVWKYFKKVKIRSKKGGHIFRRLKCRECSVMYKHTKGRTTTQIKRHLNDCIGKQGPSILLYSPSGAPLPEIELLSVSSKKYDHNRIREIMAKMIIVHEYPFKMVEHFWFNVLLKCLNPNYEPVSRVTIASDCMKVYGAEKEKLKNILNGVDRVSLTSNTWASNQRRIAYMCLTIHYVDLDWKLQKRIVNFCELGSSHAGIDIGDAIMDCLLEWGIEDKVSTITLDNVSSNDVAARSLMSIMDRRGHLFYKGIIFHIRCCAHILNILVQDGLKKIEDAIVNVRESVKYIKKSPSRLKRFAEICKQLNVSTFRGLCIDASTRWNSTYDMLDSALVFECVFQEYQLRDDNFKWLPSNEEWENVRKIKPFLEIFYDVTNVFSATTYLTANQLLPEIWKVKQVLLQHLASEDEDIRSMAEAMSVKFDKYWGKCHLVMSIAAVMDPRYKMKLVEYCFPRIYHPWEVDANINEVRTALYDIYNAYLGEHTSFASGEEITHGPCSSANAFGAIETSKGKRSGHEEFRDFLLSSRHVRSLKSELDIYLEEENFIDSPVGNLPFDALDWWKLNSLKFKILSKMARDILAIPVSTVASESAFSAGGRVLDDYRSCLATKTVEALVCTADWLRAGHKIVKSPILEIREKECLQVDIPDISNMAGD